MAKDPSLLKDVFDKEKTDAAVKKWKKATNMVKNVGMYACAAPAIAPPSWCAGRKHTPPLTVVSVCHRRIVARSCAADPADAASYTVEYEEFKQAVSKVKKLKIGDSIVENPSEEMLLKAWKEEEVKRALARETKGEEPLTRPVKGADGAVSYLPPVVTKKSSPEVQNAHVLARTRICVRASPGRVHNAIGEMRACVRAHASGCLCARARAHAGKRVQP